MKKVFYVLIVILSYSCQSPPDELSLNLLSQNSQASYVRENLKTLGEISALMSNNDEFRDILYREIEKNSTGSIMYFLKH